MIIMEISEQIKRAYIYYKNRYEKAQELGIQDNSPYYAAFKEIETRYVGLYFCIEFVELFPQNLSKSYLCHSIKLIGDALSPYQIGEIVHLDSNDTVGYTLYKQAKEAKEAMITTYKKGFEDFVFETIENLCKIVQWQIYVRELKMPVVKVRT